MGHLGSIVALYSLLAPPTFERDVRPILARRCNVCHNVKELSDPDTSAGLALDSYEAALKGTGRRKVVVPGRPDESGLFTRLNEADDERRMPLSDAPLPRAERALIRRWITAGAPRGEPVLVARAAPSARPARRVVRALDVALALPTTPPRTAPLALRLRLGPLPPVSSLAIDGEGKRLAVGTYGLVTIWDLPRREVVRVIDDLPGPVLALAFSPDGRTLAAGAGLPARSGAARIYSLADGSLVRAFEGHGDAVAGLAFRPDGKQLATASYDATVRFWEVDTGKPSGVFKGHSDFVLDVAYLPDGRSVLSCGKDRTIKRVDAATASELRTYGEHDDEVLTVAVRPDGSGFVSAGGEPQVRSWALDADKSSKKVGGNSGPVHQLAYSRDGKRLASACGDGSIRVFDGVTGAAQRALPGPTEWQYAVAVGPDGRLVAGGGWDGVVRLWDAGLPRLEAVLLQPPSPSPGQASWLAIAPDGKVAGSPDLLGAVRWVVDGKEQKDLPPPGPAKK